MKKISNAFLFCLAWTMIIMLFSCREENYQIFSYAYDSNDTSNFDEANSSFTGQFKAIWTAMNCNYPIWDYEERFGIDWDDVYEKYYPVFRSFDERLINKCDTVTLDEFSDIYAEILSPLHDGHFSAQIRHLYREQIIMTGSHVLSLESKPANMNYYLNSNDDNNQIEEHLKGKKCEYALFKKGIVYFSISSIDFSYIFHNNDSLVWYCWFDKIQELHKNGSLSGIIIDVRNNHGGNGSDYQYLLGALQEPDAISNKINFNVHQLGKIRGKSGYGRLDYLPLEPFYVPIYPKEHEIIDKQPIVLLANGETASNAEHICLGAKQLNNGCVIGTQTAGALSPLAPIDENGIIYSMYYSGTVGYMNNTPFYLYIPIGAFFTNEGEILESIGITPDIECPLDEDLYISSGRDSQLERALEYIRTR